MNGHVKVDKVEEMGGEIWGIKKPDCSGFILRGELNHKLLTD